MLDALVIPLDGRRRRGEVPLRAAANASASGGNKVVRLWQACPHTDAVTQYDRENVYLYGHLLTAEAEGDSLQHMALVFFHINVDRHPARAAVIVRSHLARAHWLKENVFPFLDW